MKTRASVLFLLTVLLPLQHCLAQIQPVYIFQQDDTLLKRAYYNASLAKKSDLLRSATRNTAAYKKIYDEQFEEVGKLLLSKRAVTAPQAHAYLQSLLQQVTKANPELQNAAVRVLFTRDWWPNAYCMGDGTIAVNAGLMIYLDNEAELVFILCHELSHFYLDHTGKAITKYVEAVNSDVFQSELKRLSKEQYNVNRQLDDLARGIVFNSRRHSREYEAEADMQALRFMKRTGYDCRAAQTCLAILDHIDESSVYKPIDVKHIFTFNDYPFKNKWVQAESAIFSQLSAADAKADANERDSLKTHPDCTSRIHLLQDSITAAPGNGKTSIVNASLFDQLKKDFFIEMAEECYNDENLSRYLYYNLLMLQANENMPLAAYAVLKSFNRIYQKQKEHTAGFSIEKENEHFPADYNQLLRMIDRLRLEEIAAINKRFCQKYQELMYHYKGIDDECKKAQQLQ